MRLHQGDCLEVLKSLPDNSLDSLVTDPPAGISFMGKAWDDDKGGRKEWIEWLAEVMRECHRVLKPGAHGLVWALPRTSHWTATALEEAHFEIRDVIYHCFGSGFPKSLDVSKAIDKAAGAEREILSECGSDGVKRKPRAMAPGQAERMAVQTITAPSTDDAKKWQGFGTALKPAVENWILVRKPISEKTVAANVLKWGTGALNIDGCRIEGVPTSFPKPGEYPDSSKTYPRTSAKREAVPHQQGRFPSHLILDEEAGAQLDLQATSEVSRFFYSAKVSASERNAGLEGMELKAGGIMDHRPSGDMHTRMGNGPTAPKANNHPTVKPQKLMRYLVRMITPPGGTVLDCFMGSGSTGLAALTEGFSFVGIEREPEYLEIASKRIFSAFPEFKKEYGHSAT